MGFPKLLLGSGVSCLDSGMVLANTLSSRDSLAVKESEELRLVDKLTDCSKPMWSGWKLLKIPNTFRIRILK